MVNKSKSANKQNSIIPTERSSSVENNHKCNDDKSDQYDYVLSTLSTLKFRNTIKYKGDRKSDEQIKNSKNTGSLSTRSTNKKAPIVNAVGETALPSILTDFVRSYDDINSRKNSNYEQTETDEM